MIRILVIDDHPIVREGLVSILENQADFNVSGAVGSAKEALDQIKEVQKEAQPDILLLDLELPCMNGLEAIPHLITALPQSRILVLTAYDTEERVLSALRAGAKGYLLKGATGEEISQGIRIVHGGGTYLSPRVAALVVSHLGEPHSSRALLTPREREVLHLIAQGQSNKQIARSLTIAETTVKFHLQSLFRKLEASNRAQVVALAVQQGLL